MFRFQDIINFADSLAPQNIAYDWDNSGLQIGNPNQEITEILISLDVNESVINEAIDKKCQLIISHHPMIFESFKKIDKKDYQGSLIYKVIRNNLNIFSMHTNLDLANDGINDYLAFLFELENVQILKAIEINGDSKIGLGRIGTLKQFIKLNDFLRIVKKLLKIPYIKYVGDLNSFLSTVAICSGSGAGLISDAAKKGADLLLTSDIKYHQAQLAEELGIILIEAGHYQTEVIVKSLLNDYFSSKLKGVNIYKSVINTDPWKYIV